MKKENRKLLAAMTLSLTITQIVYSNILTFFPPYRTKYHPSMSDTSIGFIIAYFNLFLIKYRIYQIAVVLFSPLIGSRQTRFGRKNIVVLGYFCLIIGSLCFGAIDRVDDT